MFYTVTKEEALHLQRINLIVIMIRNLEGKEEEANMRKKEAKKKSSQVSSLSSMSFGRVTFKELP